MHKDDMNINQVEESKQVEIDEVEPDAASCGCLVFAMRSRAGRGLDELFISTSSLDYLSSLLARRLHSHRIAGCSHRPR